MLVLLMHVTVAYDDDGGGGGDDDDHGGFDASDADVGVVVELEDFEPSCASMVRFADNSSVRNIHAGRAKFNRVGIVSGQLCLKAASLIVFRVE